MEDIEKRFLELAERSRERNIAVFSDFLNDDEQSKLLNLHINPPPHLCGGYPDAARNIAIFGEVPPELPIKLIEIAPTSKKFAPTLSHRDFLGAAMGLGIKREKLGDIIVFENTGYMFCHENIAEFILQNLTSVGRAAVKCREKSKLPEGALPKTEPKTIIVSSKRLDGVVAAVYNMSRGKAKGLFEEKRVFVNSVQTENAAYVLKPGDKVSVRGMGKFIFDGERSATKKQNLVLDISKYV